VVMGLKSLTISSRPDVPAFGGSTALTWAFGLMKLAALMFCLLCSSAHAAEPPHKAIEQAFFKCEAGRSLQGGIYGKGPFKRFGPEPSQCSEAQWVRISKEEFRSLASEWHSQNWGKEIEWWQR